MAKTCSKCGITKPLEEFYKNKGGLHGRRKDCKECVRAYERERYSDPTVAEAKIAYAKEYWATHPELRRETTRISVPIYHARRRRQFIEEVDHTVVWEMHGGCCGICKQYVPPDNFHVDHIIPVSRGGMHGYVNVQPAHPVCNLRKQAKLM